MEEEIRYNLWKFIDSSFNFPSATKIYNIKISLYVLIVLIYPLLFPLPRFGIVMLLFLLGSMILVSVCIKFYLRWKLHKVIGNDSDRRKRYIEVLNLLDNYSKYKKELMDTMNYRRGMDLESIQRKGIPSWILDIYKLYVLFYRINLDKKLFSLPFISKDDCCIWGFCVIIQTSQSKLITVLNILADSKRDIKELFQTKDLFSIVKRLPFEVIYQEWSWFIHNYNTLLWLQF